MLGALLNLDGGILLFVQENLRCPFLNWLMPLFSALGNYGIFWLSLGLVLFCFKKTRRAGFDLILCLAFSWAVSELLVKNLVQRPRPFTEIPELVTLIPRPDSFSFPSGPTCSSMASAYALCRSFGKKGALAYIPALLISLSRIYVGVHYPTDVLISMLWGTLGAALMYAVSRRFIRWKFLNPKE